MATIRAAPMDFPTRAWNSLSFLAFVEFRDPIVAASDNDADLALPSFPSETMKETMEIPHSRFVERPRNNIRCHEDGIVENEIAAARTVAPHAPSRRERRCASKQAPKRSQRFFAPVLLVDAKTLAIHARHE
jgi:hypothetical protein